MTIVSKEDLAHIKTFDEAVMYSIGKVVEQGRVYVNEYGSCVYRGESNTCCPVGWLISDEEYTTCLEGLGPFEELVYDAVITSLNIPISNDEVDVLDVLQDCHDDAKYDDFSEFLKSVETSLPKYYDMYMAQTANQSSI